MYLLQYFDDKIERRIESGPPETPTTIDLVDLGSNDDKILSNSSKRIISNELKAYSSKFEIFGWNT